MIKFKILAGPKKSEKPYPGKKYGTRDGGLLEKDGSYTAAQMSRLMDAKYAWEQAGLAEDKFWQSIPHDMAMECCHLRWTYVAENA